MSERSPEDNPNQSHKTTEGLSDQKIDHFLEARMSAIGDKALGEVIRRPNYPGIDTTNTASFPQGPISYWREAYHPDKWR